MAKSRLIISTIIWAVVAILAHYNLQHIIYFLENSSLFLFDSHYVAWHSSQVGGITDLIVSFLVQLFYYPSIGSIVIGGLVAAIYALLAWSASTKDRGDQIALAALAAIWTLSCHSFPAFMTILVVTTLNILLFKVMTIKLKRVGYALAYPFMIVAFLVIGLPFYMSAAIFALYILISKESKLLKIAYIAATALMIWTLPSLGAYIYPQSPESIEALYDKIPKEAYDTFTYIWAAYLLITKFTPEIKSTKFRWIASAAVIIGATTWGLVTTSSSNGTTAKTVLSLRQMAEKGQWEELLNAAKQVKKSNRYVTYFTNVALYKTGRFNTQIFAYPQPYGVQALFFPWSQDDKVVPVGRYAFENAGIINEAHRWLFEQGAITEESGYSLSQLIDYNIQMGRPKVANRLTKVLNRSLFYHRDLVEETTKEDTTSHQFSNQLTSPDGFEMNLRQAIEIDPLNKGASDYLMVYLLMMGRVADFAAVVDIPQAIYGDKMPEIYNEAMALYAKSAPEEFAESGYQIPDQTIKRLARFEQLMQSSRGNNAAISKEFRGSYWYYYVYMNPYNKRR